MQTDNIVKSIAIIANIEPQYDNIFVNGLVKRDIACKLIKGKHLDEFANILSVKYLKCEGGLVSYAYEYKCHILSDYGGSKIFSLLVMREFMSLSRYERATINGWDMIVDCYVRSGYFIDGIDIMPSNMFIAEKDYALLSYIHPGLRRFNILHGSDEPIACIGRALKFISVWYRKYSDLDARLYAVLDDYWMLKIPVDV